MIPPAFQLKKKQYLYAGLAAGTGLALIGVLLWSLEGGTLTETSNSTPIQETNITTAGQRVNPQEMWVERIESENKLTQKKLDALEQLLNANINSAPEHKDPIAQKFDEIDQDNPMEIPQAQCSAPESLPHAQVLPSPPFDNDNSSQSIAPSGLRKIILKLSNQTLGSKTLGSSGKGPNSKQNDSLTIENTLPAGTFAKAILLGGVDASTSISSQSDPRPLLLRLMDSGNLPRKFKSDLKDCHILASSYGDLSSERVYMRLEKLTCTERLTGEISETQVAGYVLGEDGRAGVRGVVVDKAGPLIRNSLVGGFFSGMGQFFGAQQQSSAFPVSPFGQTRVLAPQQMLSAGASQGASNAMEKYADFFIKRAEQLQPVLQVAAGREVDIVFTQGTRFGETTVRKSLTKIRNQFRKQAIQNLEGESDTHSDTQSWLPQTPGLAPEGDE